MRVFRGVLLFLCCVLFATEPNDATRRWWSHVQALANDGMEGRETGTEAYRNAARYVVTQFERAGLKPAGEKGYYQTVPMHEVRLLTDQSRAELVRGDTVRKLEWLRQIVAPARPGLPESLDAALVFAGSDPSAEGLEGKILVRLGTRRPSGWESRARGRGRRPHDRRHHRPRASPLAGRLRQDRDARRNPAARRRDARLALQSCLRRSPVRRLRPHLRRDGCPGRGGQAAAALRSAFPAPAAVSDRRPRSRIRQRPGGAARQRPRAGRRIRRRFRAPRRLRLRRTLEWRPHLQRRLRRCGLRRDSDRHGRAAARIRHETQAVAPVRRRDGRGEGTPRLALLRRSIPPSPRRSWWPISTSISSARSSRSPS